MYASYYESPIGKILISASENALLGLWFLGQSHYSSNKEKLIFKDNKIIIDTKEWLNIYFGGHNPRFKIPVFLDGTEFQKNVWQQLIEIPFGQTTTYKQIAKSLGIKGYQAVGAAIGKNKISIIIPCHRVIGKNGSLTGYAGGLDKKDYLLNLERKENNDKSR